MTATGRFDLELQRAADESGAPVVVAVRVVCTRTVRRPVHRSPAERHAFDKGPPPPHREDHPPDHGDLVDIMIPAILGRARAPRVEDGGLAAGAQPAV